MSRNSIQTKFSRNMATISIVSILLWSIFWIQGEYSNFKIDSEQLRLDYIHSQKSEMKLLVINLADRIKLRKSQTKNNLKKSIKERVNAAHLIASTIYAKNVNSKTPEQIIEMISDILRPIRFDNGKGYYFAVSMEGIEILYPVKPEFEGHNVIDLKDAQGNFVIKDEIKTAREKGEGFITHFWPKPEAKTEKLFPKISYVKYFKPLDLYIGTGAYLDEAKKQNQHQMLTGLALTRFGADGYFFGSTFSGDPLFSNGKVTLGQKSIWDLTDPNGVKIIQEQRKAAEKKEGSFVNYSWPRLKNSNPSPKISFVVEISEWEWTIGAGFYTDDLNSTIAAQKALMEKHLKEQILRGFFALIILLFLTGFWSKRISDKIKLSIETFSSFLKNTSTDSITINPEQLELQEFKEIATLTNEMLVKRIQAEESLQESEEKFRKMYESTQIGIAIVSLDFKILEANQAYCDMLGYSEKELTGKTLMEITSPEDISKNIEKQTQLGQEIVTSFQMEKKFIHKNGETVHGLLSATLINDKYQNPQYFLGNVVDITPRKIAEESKKELENKLQQAQRMEAIGSLAGGIAHDFNNVLFSIMGFTEITMADMEKEDKNRENLDQVLIAANRAKEMVQHILAFSRQTETEKKPVQIQHIMDEVLKLLKHSIPSTIEIKATIDKNSYPVFADPVQIHQVIMNLATNSSHAMKEKGGIMEFIVAQKTIIPEDLTTYPNLNLGEYIEIQIKDTGHGISKDNIGKIFNPYFTTKNAGEGSGMGLSVVHGIILGHNGGVLVKSEPDRGTSFHILLPMLKESKKKNIEAEMPPDRQSLKGLENVLFIDDDIQITDMTQKLLGRLGYTVTPHTDSQKALEDFKNEPDKFDIVITDMTMPIMTGTQLAQELFKIKPDVKIILCSGYSDLIDEKLALDMGIQEYITKPITQKQIAEAIRKVLRKGD